MNNNRLAGAARRLDESEDESAHAFPAAADILGRSTEALAMSHGFEHYWVGTFPTAAKPGFAENRIAENWPDFLMRAYDASDAFMSSPLIRSLQAGIVPLSLPSSSLEAAGDVVHSQLEQEFARAGFQRLLAFSVHDSRHRRYLLLLSGRSATANLAAILYDATRHIDAYSKSLQSSGTAKSLSRRETQCLSWAAAGKSSDEIATILGISPHTVNFYLATATRKLDCVNRMHAIAHALRSGLI